MNRFHVFTLLFLAPGVAYLAETSVPAESDVDAVRAAQNEALKQSMQQRPLWRLQKENYKGSAFVGVDALGRVAVATDEDGDGLADLCFLMTAEERLQGPWSWYIPTAKIQYLDGRLLIESKDRDYALSVAMTGRQPLKFKRSKYASVFTNYTGVEFVPQVAAPGVGAEIANMSHADIGTWPENFWYDLLDPASNACQEGAGDNHFKSCDNIDCSVTNPIGVTGCAVSQCAHGNCGPITCDPSFNKFACCKCGSFISQSSCRCKQCTPPAPGGSNR